ncbi:MAG TPA: hypothetical protein VFR75_11575 [Solirubrobacterales bacterium]|nr:hypothetical protein [Solirubrobacterales bacterium]
MAVVLAASGCGEDDGAAETAAALSKAEFTEQANAICAKANQEITKTSEQFAKENLSEEERPTTAQISELAKLALPTINRQLEELRALGAPAGDEQEVDAIFAAAEEALAEGEQEPIAIYGANGGAFEKANQLATAYGLDKCGE